MKTNILYNADCLDILKDIPDNSIDCMVTDPPYGIAFMGKDWDKALPQKNILEECLRVLKPGAFAFIMSIPRQDCLSRMITKLDESGFNIQFSSIYWVYLSGKPKILSMSKSIDKKLGVTQEIIGKQRCTGSMATATKDKGGTFASGTRINNTGAIINLTTATSDEAKEMDGSYGGNPLKPALEVILVVMKPITEKTYVSQAMDNKKGVSWLDYCKIPYTEEEKKKIKFDNPKYKNGRFPANVLVSDDALQDYSKYFSLDRWWQHKIKSFKNDFEETFPFIHVKKPNMAEKTCNNTIDNRHPTIKPVDLMSFLIEMGSMPDDIILDPFSGSGTTGVASMLSNRQFICIDKDEEAHHIATERLNYTELWMDENDPTE